MILPMKTETSAAVGTEPSPTTERLGTLAAFATYGMWGLFPLYWKALASVDPLQILCHRIIWAAVFTLVLLLLTRNLADLLKLLKDKRLFVVVVTSGILITSNWGIYIWAVNNSHIADSSLGYYINPLLSVALGAFFFRERMDRFTSWAVGIAAIGVAVASILLGAPPWISLALASTLALYGVVKKKAGLKPLVGLAAETLVVTPFALAWLVRVHLAGHGALGGPDVRVTIMLVAAGIVTAVPLITFAYATNRITLQRLGFIQYVSPTSQMILGLVVFGEQVSFPQMVAFGTVIAAILLYVFTRARVNREGALHASR